MISIENREYSINTKEIILAHQNLKQIPKEIGNLQELQTLGLSYNQLTEIPKEIGNLQQLQRLLLFSNQLTEIPKEIGNLQQLQILLLYFNRLTKIPKEIGNLQQLQKLYLTYNQLTEIPKKIGNLQQLQKLYLSGNQLTEIPKEIGNLQELQTLYLSSNKLTEIPKEIGNLQELQTLYLLNNQLTEIPKEIGNLQQLQTLDLSNNQLAKIPKEIGNLQQLQTLDLSNNQLTEIPKGLLRLPKGIGNLQQLQNLNLSDNQLAYIPLCIIYLPRLCNLYIHNNPIENLHPAITRFLNNNKTIQNIYSDNQSVHNHNIEFTTNKSVIDFISSYKCKETDIDELVNELNIPINIKNILLNYCTDEYIHSRLQLNYKEILLPVLDFIKNNVHKEELLKILYQEIQDSLGKCFQGRISRTINILNGYHECVNINISDNEQIGNLIINLQKKYLDLSELEENFIKEMQERNYTNEIIKEWINYIQENY